MSKLYYDNAEEYIDGEEWKEHPLYTNYEGSSLGRIRKKNPRKVLRQCFVGYTESSKRLYCSFRPSPTTRATVHVSRFILECFLGIQRELQADHIDSNPINNCLYNLRWVTIKENANNPNSLQKRITAKKQPGNRISVKCITLSGELVKTFNSIEECAIFATGESSVNKRDLISKCVRGKISSAYGYRWEYADVELLEGEIFKKHPTLDIDVSNMGRIMFKPKNHRPMRITYGTDSFGYRVINVDGKRYRVHRLVLETFYPNVDEKPYVNHKNCNRQDNRLENLEWCTQSENLKSELTSEKLKNLRSKKIDVFNKDGTFMETFNSMRDAANTLKCSQGDISDCCLGNRKTHKGYIFKFNEVLN